MNEIIGQEKLLENINRSSLDNWPRAFILLGDAGSGKHTLIDYISRKFNLATYNITPVLNQELITELSNKSTCLIYVIESNEITYKQQNMLLKFIEEPPQNAFICILCEHRNSLLSTIWNRCVVYEFAAYKQDELEKFIKDNVPTAEHHIILDIGSTPGQVIELQNFNLSEYITLGYKLFDNISTASLPNTLSVVEKLNYGKEQGKLLNIHLFIKILYYCILQRIKNTTSEYYYQAFKLVNTLCFEYSENKSNAKELFTVFLLDLWNLSRK